MAIKPIIALKPNETFQNINGKLEDVITVGFLSKNPNMHRTHPNLFENAAALEREDALKGSVKSNDGSVAKAHVAIIKETGERSIVFSAAPKQSASASREKLSAMLAEKVAQVNALAVQELTAEKANKKGSKKDQE